MMHRRCIAITSVLLVIALCSPVFARGHRGRSPRGGGGWGGMALAASFAYARQIAAWRRAEAIAEAIRKAKNNAHRMKYADQARKDGKPRLAATLYVRVVHSRPKDKHADAAKSALAAMVNEGRAEMKQADALLAQNKIVEAFEKLDHLAWAYEEVPKFNHEIQAHVAKLHRESRYQAVLNEKPAAALLAEGRKEERNDERCCAYWTYEEAAKLAPAPSALKAADLLAEMNKDPELVAEAKECRLLRECHHTFHDAELVEKSLPGKAEILFEEVLKKAPRDSEVYRCAQEELAKLRSGKRPT